MKRFIFSFLAWFLISFSFSRAIFGCASTDKTEIRPPESIYTDIEWCSKAEDNLKNLGCQEAQVTKKGKTFTMFCVEKQLQGIFLNPKCISEIKKCDQVDICTNSK